MSLSRIFKTNKTLEEKGTPVKFPANVDGTVPTFYLARMAPSNVKYQKALEEATRPYRREIALQVLPEKKALEINIGVFVSAILTGWENVLQSDVDSSQLELREVGEPEQKAPFNAENATKLMYALPELFAELKQHAANMANFLDANLQDEAKN